MVANTMKLYTTHVFVKRMLCSDFRNAYDGSGKELYRKNMFVPTCVFRSDCWKIWKNIGAFSICFVCSGFRNGYDGLGKETSMSLMHRKTRFPRHSFVCLCCWIWFVSKVAIFMLLLPSNSIKHMLASMCVFVVIVGMDTIGRFFAQRAWWRTAW